MQFAVSLAFAVRCAAKIQRQFAVRLRLPWALRAPVCRVPVLCRVLHWIFAMGLALPCAEAPEPDLR
jgi:hypothetical protein